jgi:cytochrome c oxidase subunit 2
MHWWKKVSLGLAAALASVIGSAAALAAPAVGAPHPWEMGLQRTYSPIGHEISWFNNLVLIVAFAISALVFVLLIYACFRFRASRNPVPSHTHHNTVLEVMWTVIPVMILVVIAIPSYKLLYAEDFPPPIGLTVEAVGHQWYWSYAYPKDGNFSFFSMIVPTAKLKPGQPRLLTVDHPLVVPVNTNILVKITSTDVLHDWFVPSLGVQKEAVPGRINETWFRAERVGTYYGECNELCGIGHSRMPIEVKVLSKPDFARWLAAAKKEYSAGLERRAPAMPSRLIELASASE